MLIYNEQNFDESEECIILPTTSIESCYDSWSQEIVSLNTANKNTSILHSPNKTGMLDNFREYWM